MSTGLALALLAAALAAAAAVGFLFGQLRASRRAEELRAELEGARARLASQTERAAEQAALLERSELQLRSAFDEIAGATLRSNSEIFLQLARETLGRERVEAQAGLREREAAMTQLLAPIRTALEKTEQQVVSLERERRDAFTTLRAQLEGLASGQSSLARETRNLVTALRRPEVRGRWGELTLRRVVELAGLASHCDFTEQVTVAGDDGSLRPDLVVHMPDQRDLVIDVKTPLDAYLEALEATTEEARLVAMRRHAAQVEARVRALASKSYWAQFERSPEFAVLFLPGDQFLSSALAENPDLLDFALRQSVIIATPSTLIALLKAVAYGWRQAEVARNAATIRDLGQELHKRMSTFATHLAKVGRNLAGAVESYNGAVGSLERSVLPQARRFTELGVTNEASIAELTPLDHLPRVPAGATEPPPALTDDSAVP